MQTSDSGQEYISISIDNTQAKNKAKETADSFSSIGESAERAGKRMDDAVERLGRQAAAQARYVAELNKQYSDQKDRIADLDKEILQHKELQELNRKEVEQLTKKYNEAKESQGSWTQSAKDLKQQLDNAKQGYQQESDAIKDLNIEKQKATQQAQNLQSESRKEAQSLKDTTQQLKEAKDAAAKIPTVNDQIAETMKTIGKLSAGYLSVKQAKAFLETSAKIRGELEQMQTQFEGLFGETEGGQLFGDVRGMAMSSGLYSTGALSQAAETLNVYGEETENIMPLLREFGDIAMGNEQKMDSLATALGRVEMEGKLSSLTLRTMTRAGFNPLEEMARKTGTSVEVLRQRMKNGEITTEQVKEAFKSATSEGGKYYNMTNKLSGGIKAEQQRLELMIKGVYAKWGAEHESLILGSIKLRQWVVQNIGTIAKWLGVLITTYGTYKAAIITLNAVETTQAAGYVTKIRLLRLMAAAQAALNTVVSMNPYVLAATALGALTAAVIAFSHKSSIAADATSDWNAREKSIAQQHERRKEKLNELLQKIQDETSSEYERQDALNELKRMLPSVFKKYDTWISLQNQLAQATAQANQQLAQQNILQGGQNMYKKSTKEVEALRQYRKDINNGVGSAIAKAKLYKAAPELFEVTRGHVNFKGQGTFETDYHASGVLLGTLEKQVDKGVKDTQKKLATMWDATLPNKSNKQINAMAKFYAGKLAEFNRGNKTGTKTTVRKVNGQTVYTESVTPAKNPKTYIEFKDATGTTVRLTKAEVQRRLSELRKQQNVAKNNAGRDYLKEAQTSLAKAQKAERDVIKNRKNYRSSEAYEMALANAKKAVEDAQSVVERRSQGSDLTKQDKAAAGKNKSAAKAAAAKEAKEEKERQREAIATDKSQNKQTEEDQRYQQEAEKNAKQNAYAIEQATIDGMEEGEAKKLRQAALNHQKEKDQLDEQERELYEQKVEHAKALWEADPKSKGAGFWSTHTRDKKTGLVSGIAPLTDEETSGIDAQRKSEDIRYGNEVQQILQQSMDSLIEYYKNFGTLEEQRYAIAKDYDEKIAKATTEGEKKSLEAQKQRDLATAGANSLANDIDWSHTFEGVGNVLGDIARQTLEKVEKYMNTDEFKRQKPSDQKAYIDLRDKLQQETGGQMTSPFNFGQWGRIAKQVKEYQQSVRTLQEKTKAHSDAVKELQDAEKRLKNANTDMAKTIEQNNVDVARGKVNVTGEQVEAARSDTQKKQQKLNDSTTKAANGLNNFAAALQQMSSGSLHDFANGVTKLITGLVGGSKSVGKSLEELGGKIGGIIGAILQILDALGDDPKGFINDLFERITTAVGAILSDLPDLVGSIIKDVGTLGGSIIEGFGEMFGAKEGWLYGSNAKEVKKITEELTKSNDALKTSIDSLKETIENENGINTITDTQKALQAQKKVNENQMSILEAQMGYHSHHHSNAYYWGLGDNDYAQINRVLADYASRHPEAQTTTNSVYSLGDIYKLTPEQMNEIRTNLADVWTSMLEQGKYDKSEYWTAYADLAGKTDEITNTLREKLTGITFDSMHDDFVDKLMDMENKASDFTKDVNKQFAKGLLNFAIGTKLDSRLKQWWQNWADTMEQQSGNLTESQIDNMRTEYEAFVSEGMQIRDRVFKVTGYDKDSYSQDSSKSVLEGVTQDQVEELNGRMSSVQINLDKIAQQIQEDYKQNGNMLATVQDIRSIMDDLLDLQNDQIGHLQKIETYTSELPGMSDKLEKIRKSVEHL